MRLKSGEEREGTKYKKAMRESPTQLTLEQSPNIPGT
jgi:hypothetical protein